MVPEDNERGYALLAAVLAMLAFGYIAYEVLALDRGALTSLDAKVEQAKLSAAADAGVQLAIHALANPDVAARWYIDGRARRVDFDGTDLSIVVEDERAKAPLSSLNDDQARTLFEGAGAQGGLVDTLVSEYRAWVSEDSQTPENAPPPERPIRHGPFATVDELIGLPDMTPALLSRIKPAVTVFFDDNGLFEPRDATPLASAIMNADIGTNPDNLSDATQIADERPVEDIATNEKLDGRALTVRVVARSPDGAHTHRMAIVSLTGDPRRPYYVRYVE
jgi:general secretion pathway protein K